MFNMRGLTKILNHTNNFRCCRQHLPTLGFIRENYTFTDFNLEAQSKLTYRQLPHPKENVRRRERVAVPQDFRFVYPEFLPLPEIQWRNKLKEHLERKDMLARRTVLDIPEFYVGSVMGVTVSDPHSPGKTSRFTGICLDRGGSGMRAWFVLRNHIDKNGVEIRYDMYCPLIKSIETLRLEKSVDPELYYLRDALPEYSTFPLDMEQELITEDSEVPVNEHKVKMLPRPWAVLWYNKDVAGIDYEGHITEKEKHDKARKEQFNDMGWAKYDLMLEYRMNIPEEEQEEIFKDVAPHYSRLKKSQRQFKRRKDN